MDILLRSPMCLTLHCNTPHLYRGKAPNFPGRLACLPIGWQPKIAPARLQSLGKTHQDCTGSPGRSLGVVTWCCLLQSSSKSSVSLQGTTRQEGHGQARLFPHNRTAKASGKTSLKCLKSDPDCVTALLIGNRPVGFLLGDGAS